MIWILKGSVFPSGWRILNFLLVKVRKLELRFKIHNHNAGANMGIIKNPLPLKLRFQGTPP